MNNTKRMKTFYLDEQTVADIEATAKEYGMSQSSVVQVIMNTYKDMKKKERESEWPKSGECNRCGVEVAPTRETCPVCYQNDQISWPDEETGND